MPVHNVHPVGFPDLPADLLHLRGLLLQVVIDIPLSLAGRLTASGQTIPTPAGGNALVDTGASCSCVEERLLQRLQLQPVNQVKMTGATGARLQNVYHPRLLFPGTPIPPLEMQVVGVQMNQLPLVCLLGRDVLRHFVLIYNGPQGSYTIAF
jgi:hypothetical protein